VHKNKNPPCARTVHEIENLHSHSGQIAHPEVGSEVSSRKIGKPSHSDAAVCPGKFHWILSPRKLQDLHYDMDDEGGWLQEHW